MTKDEALWFQTEFAIYDAWRKLFPKSEWPLKVLQALGEVYETACERETRNAKEKRKTDVYSDRQTIHYKGGD